ncbi:MAG: hypothetical protein M5U32_02350 [Myxococcota bacterium]|nr:hypothetical protein [Myxococcota bacterium]
MSILRRLFRRTQSRPISQDGGPSRAQPDEAEENRAIANDPVRFADSVRREVFALRSDDADLELCPSDEQCERLSITPEQREACRREFVLMRGLGACMFVGKNLPPAYYKTFKAEICGIVAQMQFGVPTESRVRDISDAIDRYVEELQNETPTGFSLTYLERVYSGNPHIEGMFFGTIFLPAFQLAMTFFKGVRQLFCMLRFGVPYEVLEALNGAPEQRESE